MRKGKTNMALIKFGHASDQPAHTFTKVAAPGRRGGFLIRTGTNMNGDNVGGGGFFNGVGTGVGIGVGVLALGLLIAAFRGRQIA